MSRLFLLLLAPLYLLQAMEHTRTEFEFTVAASYDRVAPLLGALAEQKWASGWKPQFLYPVPAEDREGSVFRVERSGHTSIWVNTIFDLAAGRVQYVNIRDGILATRIDVRLSHPAPQTTHVAVAYERTALEEAADPQVRSLSQTDAANGPEWKAAIEAYLTQVHP